MKLILLAEEIFHAKIDATNIHLLWEYLFHENRKIYFDLLGVSEGLIVSHLLIIVDGLREKQLSALKDPGKDSHKIDYDAEVNKIKLMNSLTEQILEKAICIVQHQTGQERATLLDKHRDGFPVTMEDILATVEDLIDTTLGAQIVPDTTEPSSQAPPQS